MAVLLYRQASACTMTATHLPVLLGVNIDQTLQCSLPQTGPRTKAPTSRDSQIGTGTSLEIGGKFFKLRSELGRGTYGIVFEATELGKLTEPVAVKMSMASTSKDLSAAKFECQVLRALSEVLHPGLPAAGRVPRYIAHDDGGGSSGNAVTLAMTKVAGSPLDEWLYGIDSKTLLTASMPALLDRPRPRGRAAEQHLAGAASAASALLLQLSPVFAALSEVAFHRDVSAHNLLVQPNGNQSPDFALVDFGLAVSSGTWREKWRSGDLSGDPRYWSPAAWMCFAYGNKRLDVPASSGMKHLYEERIDHFAFGMLVLEVFFVRWAPACEASCTDDLMRALKAWRSYWVRSYDLFQRVLADTELAREQLTVSGEVYDLVMSHEELCSSLRKAAAAEADGPAGPLLLAAVELIDTRGTVAWEQIPDLLSSSGAAVCASSRAGMNAGRRRSFSLPGDADSAAGRCMLGGSQSSPLSDFGRRRSEPTRSPGGRSGPAVYSSAAAASGRSVVHTGRQCM